MKRKKFFFVFLTFILVIVVSGALMEIVLRRVHTIRMQKARANLDTEICTMASKHPELIWENRPYKCFYNGKGYRDFDYTLVKPANVFRIIIIGDSVALGQGMPFNKIYGKMLEQMLNSRLKSSKTFEVIILARSGYSMQQELFILQHETLSFSPDLIIWSYMLNDPAHPVFHDVSYQLADYYYNPKSYLLNFIEYQLFLLNEKKQARHCPDEFHAKLHCIYWDKLQKNFHLLGSFSKTNAIPIVFMIHPVFEKDAFKRYSLAGLHEKIANSVRVEGLHDLDLLPLYRPYDGVKLFLKEGNRTDPWHPNAKGHMLIATGLFRYVLKHNFFTTNEHSITYIKRRVKALKWKRGDNSDLDRFTGIYRLTSENLIKVIRNGDMLKADFGIERFGRLFRKGEVRFFAPKWKMKFIFHISPGGEVQLVSLLSNNRKTMARRTTAN
ncbi:MAG: hypothetical protein A2Y62_06150 [Candidatus Fischerbacteria bacterium RBG_13_37_8]|uniref:SGNH hydrolase-type esterase domain-containing protein n=1 Tax=Candidatus Fischerbacteria bacterium RBG_13_37_8 TaxID=1817863 RepID=A0A1F5VVL3_9BACT|nr:MAG: hypothetical protein A2Y62_06150 [Candidatus Fischerbacteria bacterium RBG_13_37_8]